MYGGIRTAIAAMAIAGAQSVSAWEQETYRCGVLLRPEDVPIVRARQSAGIYDPPAIRAAPSIVPVAFHVVRRSDGTGGLDETRLLMALDDANEHFSQTGIHFCWIGPIDYIDSDAFYNDIDTSEEIASLAQTNVVEGAINVYVTEHLANEGGTLCGVAYYSWSEVQGIVLANTCTASDWNRSTFSHELGHYFDLFHTHETAFGTECVDGSNCDTAGDLLCDTPADPTLGPHNVDNDCNYFGSETDPCHDAPYKPEPTNLMSYSLKHCRVSFSPQQAGRALATLVNVRPELIIGDCPGGEHWRLDGKLTATDASADDHFGWAVAAWNDRLVVGAPGDDTRAVNAGAAYVFRYNGTRWVQEAKLLASDGRADDEFGTAVAIHDDLIAVGAPRDNILGVADRGSVYVFRFDGSGWVQEAKLIAADGGYDDRLGSALATDGERVVAGAFSDDVNGQVNQGSVYLFRRFGGVWAQEQKLLAADGFAWDEFGRSVALTAGRIAVGAPRDDDLATDSGAVYLFGYDGTQWLQQTKIVADDGGFDDQFGFSLALSENLLLVGAYSDDVAGTINLGSAYVFRYNGLVWDQEAKLLADAGMYDDQFGYAVALQRDRAVIGAFSADVDGVVNRGAAYVFRFDGLRWVQEARLLTLGGIAWDELGRSVAISGPYIVAGVWLDDRAAADAGAAAVYRDLDELRFGSCPADLNRDSIVDLGDLSRLLANFGLASGATHAMGDIDDDGDVDVSDLAALLAEFGSACP